MEIRPYSRKYSAAVQELHAGAPSLDEVVANDGYAWVVCAKGQLIAYAAATPLPGLPQMVDLQAHVARSWHHHGVGSQLLETIGTELGRTGIHQLSYELRSLEDPQATFLQQHGFYLEHVEWEMALGTLDELPSFTVPGDCRLQTFARDEAIDRFRRLYEESFSDKAWYQPYSQREMLADLRRAEDLFFLMCNEHEIGFVWVHPSGAGEVRIEPLGIVRDYQRKGWGKILLSLVLRRLVEQGMQQVRITVWQSNKGAVRLYHRFGFQTIGRRYFMAYDLP